MTTLSSGNELCRFTGVVTGSVWLPTAALRLRPCARPSRPSRRRTLRPGAARASTVGGSGEESAGIGTVQAFALATGFLFVSLYKGFLTGLNNFGNFEEELRIARSE